MGSACVLAIALLASLTFAATSAADTTLGSSLEHGYEATFGGGAGFTVYQEAAAGETLIVPAPGTITSWRVRSGDMNAEYELRIIRPSGGEYTAAGTSPPKTVPDGEDKVRGPFAVSLAVKAGDRIALDVVKGLGAPISIALAPMEDALNYLQDPFPDGKTEKPALELPLGTNQELLLQADFKPGPPVNTAAPMISGEARVGSALTASEGIWEGASTFAFQWARCSGASCSPIAGATSPSYTPTSADEGQQLRVEVTATGEGGKALASSTLSDGVKPGPPPAPTNTGLPQVSGEARETETLTGTAGNWAGAPTSFAYQWLRCSSASGTNCAPIPGATTSTYTAVHDDVGSTLRLSVTATNGVGPTSAESNPTAIVQPLVIKASFSRAPAGMCTGIPIEFDGSASKTPNPPIVRYLFTYVEYPPYALFIGLFGGTEAYEEYFNSLPSHVIADGTNPTPTFTFTWDRVSTKNDEPLAPPGRYVRDPVRITLTVTDLAGASASETEYVTAAQFYDGESRSKCPAVLQLKSLASSLSAPSPIKLIASGVATKVRCVTAVPCAGSMLLSSARATLAGTSAATKARRKPVVIASDPFFSIPAHHTATVSAKLTKAGRTMLKRGKPVKAILRLTSISPAGATHSRSVEVTLHPK